MAQLKSKSLSPLSSPVVHLIVYLAFFPKKSRLFFDGFNTQEHFLCPLRASKASSSHFTDAIHSVALQKTFKMNFLKFFHLSSVPNSSGFFVRLCWLWLSLFMWSFPAMVYSWPHVPGTHLCVWVSWVPQAGPLSGGSERSLMSGLVAF